MKGPLTTCGLRVSGDFKMASGATRLKWCAGSGAMEPSTHSERNGAKACLRWKVMERWSVETSAEVIRFKPLRESAPNLGLSQSFQV